ncbi:hypothetical protein DSO57_1011048 [Entomophthora muscae]|uniref:Uncharacterized protein n=1 Tax=Entomophthora muscae TaxID=34485 RepID=A0ACC2RXA4_9FUNG|nr:hypothetical protein DSO57_1011048 [Entomophthora muscae]
MTSSIKLMEKNVSPGWLSIIFNTFPKASKFLAASIDKLVISESFLALPPESINQSLLEVGDYRWDPESIGNTVFKDCPQNKYQDILSQLNYKKIPIEPPCPVRTNERLLALIEEFKIPQDVLKLKLELVTSIIQTIKKYSGPQNRVFLTGSFKNETALNFSDVDIKIHNSQNETYAKWLERLPLYLNKHGLSNYIVINSPRRRVPLIRCQHKKLKLDVDIVYKKDHSSVTTKLFKTYALLHPTVRNSLLLLKIWAHSRKINDAFYNSMNSTSLLASLLAYLISVGVVPNIQSCWVNFSEGVPLVSGFANRSKVCTICRGNLPVAKQNLEWYFNDKLQLYLDPSINEYTLLLGYFKFMTQTFHRSYHAISMQAGGLISLDSIFHKPGGLTITDPFDLHDNLARATNPKSAQVIIWEMRRAEHLLQTANMMDAFSAYVEFPYPMYVEYDIYPRNL